MSALSSLRVSPDLGIGVTTQIRNGIALLIADGLLAPGERLPAVRDLAMDLGVNVNTVRAAYARLAADGLVETRHGVGTTVLERRPGVVAVGAPTLAANTVAVVIAGLSPFYLPLVQAIEDVAAEQGTLVLIGDARDSEAFGGVMLRQLIARGVSGLIAVSFGALPADLAGDATPPIVYVDQPQRDGHVILFDGRSAGRLATRHLIEHGHRRVAIITAPTAWPNVGDVYDGYVEALLESGLLPDPDLVAETPDFREPHGGAALAKLQSLAEPPTAVFVAGETLAVGAMLEARSRGLIVPHDLAIAGYNDSPMAELMDPGLTMVAPPVEAAGAAAMRLLARLMAGEDPGPVRQTLDVELVVRGSCGPHAASRR
ncbi:MAG: substrate-binding domain-containing protein [Chloroflexota bacterium]